MKRFLYLAGGMLLLLGLMAGSAMAVQLHKGVLDCVDPGVSGVGTIKKNGDLKIKIKGLSDPNTDHLCEVICACEGSENDSVEERHIFEAICTTDDKGKINFKAEGAVAVQSCDCPAIEVEELDESIQCRSGFDLE